MTPTSSRRILSPILFLSALAVWTSGCGGAAADSPSRQSAAREPVVVTIETRDAVERDLPTVVRTTGTFVADESSDVTPQVSGSVVETLVQVGDVVEAGQVIVRLDARNAGLDMNLAQAVLLQAEAQAHNARVEVDRQVVLVESGDISRSSYEKLTTQLLTADAAVSQARVRIESAAKAMQDTQIRAPFAGHVSARPVAVGESVTSTSKVATILRIQPIRLQLQIPESDAAKLNRGMVVRAEVPAHPGAAFQGTVSARNVALDPNSRAMTIEVLFPNADGKLLPGMFGTAEIRLPGTERAVYVPAGGVATIANGQSSAVFVIEGAIAHLRVVQTGEAQDGMVRILAGITGSPVVATSRLSELFDGAHVQVAASTATRKISQ